MSSALLTHESKRVVRWRDTDASGFAHLSAYITWMEETEYDFLRSRGLSVVLSDDKGQIGFPRLSSDVQIHQPVQFQQPLRVRLELVELDGKQLRYRFRVEADDARQNGAGEESGSSSRDADARLVATGEFCMACCRFPGDRLPYAILIPDWVEDRLRSGAIA